MRTFRQNKKGFTLVEIMVAMVITIVALLGLLQAIGLVGEKNLQNLQRDEAVHVAEEWMSRFRLEPFNLISTTTPGNTYTYSTRTVPSKLRGGTGTYRVTRTTVTSTAGDQINTGVKVEWTYKDKVTAHEVHSIRVE